VGEDVENMLVRLLAAADYDTAKAEKGIIYIDEFDKIARKSANPSITRDVSGEGVQQSMLKILEGTVASVPPKGGRKHPEQELTQINTRDILFICGGAFVGLEDIIETRLDQGRMGFNAELRNQADTNDTADMLQKVEPDDLIHYGIIPELVGRIPAIYGMESLDTKALQQILTTPKNALVKQYKKLFALENVELTFSDGALKEIVALAQKKKTGARGLRNVLESVLMPIMFELPSQKNVTHCHVTKDVVSSKRSPVYKYRDNKKIA
jgi:ATP-dependent Clp protease ATP-binding subunit ClpX